MVISGTAVTKINTRGTRVNKDISVRATPENEQDIDSRLLETNSLNNARVIEEAYRSFNSQQPQQTSN